MDSNYATGAALATAQNVDPHASVSMDINTSVLLTYLSLHGVVLRFFEGREYPAGISRHCERSEAIHLSFLAP
jgi:hypothetical protein